MPNVRNAKKVTVFAAYQLGTGSDAKMVGDESKNKFEVRLGLASEVMLEIEAILRKRHPEEVSKGLEPIVHHYQLISF